MPEFVRARVDSRSAGDTLAAALAKQERYGVGQVVFSGKEQVVLVRPYGQVLHMALLNYEAEMRTADDVAPSPPKASREARKVRLAEQIIDQWTEGEFDFSDYVDRTLEKAQALIDAKIKGHEIVKPPEDEKEPDVINLMDALKKSMEQTGDALGARVEFHVRQGLARRPRMLLWAADKFVPPLVEFLKQMRSVRRAMPVGGLRRRSDTVGDLDFLVAGPSAAAVWREFARFGGDPSGPPGMARAQGRSKRPAAAGIAASPQTMMRTPPFHGCARSVITLTIAPDFETRRR